MNNRQRKELILSKLKSCEFNHVYEALKVVGAEIECLEAVPFGKRNEPIRICEDYTDEKIDGPTSLEQLVNFVEAVPDLEQM